MCTCNGHDSSLQVLRAMLAKHRFPELLAAKNFASRTAIMSATATGPQEPGRGFRTGGALAVLNRDSKHAACTSSKPQGTPPPPKLHALHTRHIGCSWEYYRASWDALHARAARSRCTLSPGRLRHACRTWLAVGAGKLAESKQRVRVGTPTRSEQADGAQGAARRSPGRAVRRCRSARMSDRSPRLGRRARGRRSYQRLRLATTRAAHLSSASAVFRAPSSRRGTDHGGIDDR